MFNTELKVQPRPHQLEAIRFVAGEEALSRFEREPQTVANRPDITWVREERTDIDYKGYKRYFYDFKNPDAEDKELYHAIIAAPTMDAAINEFMRQVRGPDWYQGAEIFVTVIGIDLRKDDAEPWVLGDE